MTKQQPELGSPMTIGNLGELMSPVRRRDFVRRLLAGGTVVLSPAIFAACDSDDPTDPSTGVPISFDLRTDAGIFRIVDLLELLEGFYYTELTNSPNFTSFFSSAEQELFVDLRDAEIVHREFVREALGPMRVPDVTMDRINRDRLNELLSSRENVIKTARNFEHTGISGLNGASKYLQDRRNLQVTRNFATVEGRHAAALLDIPLAMGGTVSGTDFAGDNVVDGTGLDVKVEATEPRGVFFRVDTIGLLQPGTVATPPVTNPPTPNQGMPTPSFPPPIF